MIIQVALDEADLVRCFGVMQQLRPHLSQADFLQQVALQRQEGYQLVFLAVEEGVKAVAGFRPMTNLAHGKFLYIDDLVTAGDSRSRGYGHELLTWLEGYAVAQGFTSLQLDSGLQRESAHRFYLREGFTNQALRFAKPL